ncbi:MAG: sugar phosphate isomerase/epimerase [Kiritimatiellae bacterium]|nr:sugar phosphate isomerase/epimerase [Kiritimatiellia bacterium]
MMKKTLVKGVRLLAAAATALAIAGCSCGTCCKTAGKKGPAHISTFAIHVYEVMEKKGMTMQQAVDAFKAVGVSGFDGEYTDPRLDELAAAGLKPAMIYGVMSFRDPSKDEIEQNKYLGRAKKLGAKYMMIVPDHMKGIKDDPSDPVYEREFLKTMDGLKRLVAKCKAAGICPLVEDFGYRTNPGSHFCNLKRYFAEIPDLYFALDTGNVMYSDRGTDILEEFEYFHDKIRHVHVKDHPKGGPQDYALPGEGVVPNEKMLRQLFSEGYDGWVTLELFGAPDMLDAVTKTCAFINSCR